MYGLFHRLTFEGRNLLIKLHVEGLDLLGIVSHDDRFLEILLHQVTLMLAGQVVTPIAWELELLLSRLDGFLQNLHAPRVIQADKVFLEDAFQTLYQALVDHLVEEIQIILAVVKSPTDAILDEILLDVHQLRQVNEANLRLYHPEFSQMAGSVAVLGTERRTEGIDGTQCCSTQLSFQLTGHGQRCLLAKEIIRVYDTAILILLQVIQVLGCHLEHLASAFAITGSDERGMEIEISMLVEISMDSHRHIVTDTHHGTKGIGTETHVSMLAHVFKSLAFLLHGIVASACSQDFYLLRLNLTCLTCSRTLHKFSFHAEACTCGDLLQHLFTEIGIIPHNLHILDRGTIVQSNKENAFAPTLGTYPTFHANISAEIRTLQSVYYFCPFHRKCYLLKFRLFFFCS